MMTQKSRILLLAGLFTFFILMFGVPANADPLDTWHVRNPLPNNKSLHSVAYGKETFVAVGGEGRILTSYDSVRWVNRKSPVDGKHDLDLNSVIFANNMFVAVGARGTILTSPDSLTWKKRASGIPGGSDFIGNHTLHGVTFGNGKFVVVGVNGIILISNDGVRWKKGVLPVHRLCSVTFGNGMFVAVGFDGVILTSADGSIWTQQVSPITTPYARLYRVTYGNGTFVAVGSNNPGEAIATSPDGITWTARTSPNSGYLNDVIFANNMFVAAGTYGIITSPDGATWTSSGIKNNFDTITFANNIFVAAGTSFGTGGHEILTSSDLSKWTLRHPNISIESRLFSVNYGLNTFVAVGGDEDMNYGTIVASHDGITWGETLRTEYVLSGVVFANNTFVAVGYNGIMFTSPEGIAWTPVTSPTSVDLLAVTYGNNTFVAVGKEGMSLTSPDRATWTQNTLPNSPDLLAVAFGNNTFVAVGKPYNPHYSGSPDDWTGFVATSPDGITWTERTSPSTSRLVGVSFGNNTFVAVGYDDWYGSPDQPFLITSPDGVTWTTRRATIEGYAEGYHAVVFANDIFVAVGYCGQILTSRDGLVWSPREWEYYGMGCHSFHGVTFGNNTFLAVGRTVQWGPYVVQSDPVAGDYFNLTVESSGPGTVTSLLPGIDCGRDCSETLFQNTQVTLLATPELNSAFTGWTGCDTADGYFCTVIMNSAKNVGASFITVDFTGPTLSIKKPSGKPLTEATALVSGTATDSKKGNNGIVQVMVNGERATNDTAEGKQKARWSATVPLEIGNNIINVVATDGAGNTTTTTRTVTRLSESLTISSGIAQNN